MKPIGVIGCGVVGSAVANAFEQRGAKVFRYDKYRTEYNDLPQIFEAEVTFVCVPTPTDGEGDQDLSSLHDVFEILRSNSFKGVICIKSTVLPGTTEALAHLYKLERVVHNPEFLTEAKPLEDFLNQEAVIIGGPIDCALEVARAYQDAGFHKILVSDTARHTEIAKYMSNNFLAVKVLFMNEMFDFCKAHSVSYDEVLKLSLAQGKIGAGHTKIPGPDGKFGVGGMCFPKDMKASLCHALDLGLEMPILHAAVESNLMRRPEVM